MDMVELVQDIPEEFKDEEKWFKFFSLKSLIFMTPGMLLTYALFKALIGVGMAVLGIVLGLITISLLYYISSVPRDERRYLEGGGLTYDQIIIRKIIRYRNRDIYVKGLY